MNKRILSALLAGAMLCSTAPTVFATELKEVEITKNLEDINYKRAAYELYLNSDLFVSLSEDGQPTKPVYDEKPEIPKNTDEPDATQVPGDDESETELPTDEPELPTEKPLNSVYPSKYNAVDDNIVTPVKDQVLDGDCWAFAATSVFETSLLKSGLAKDAETFDLSEKHLTDNTYKNDENPWSFDYEAMGHSGVPMSYFTRGSGPVFDNGNGNDASSYDAEKYGVNTDYQAEFSVDEIVKIPDVDLIAVPVTEETDKSEDYGRVSIFGGYVVTNPEDITEEIENNSYIMRNQAGYDLYRVGFYAQMEAVKKAITNEGSVYTTMSTRAGETEKDEYEKRDFDYFFNYETNAFYNYIFTDTDHAVTLVGWDNEYSKDNFVNPPEYDGAWIVKNSWGTNQLDHGYMYVSYYDTKICTDVISISAAKKNSNEKIFQYDEFGSTGTLNFGIDEKSQNVKLWALNRFENDKTEGEMLTKVGVFVSEANTICNVYVRSQEENTDSNIGGITSTSKNGFRNEAPLKTVTFEYPGYYVIELDEPVEIWGDFEVAVKYDFESSESLTSLALPVEMASEKQYVSKAGTTNRGESYYAVDHGEGYKFSWYDLYDSGAKAEADKYRGLNACIKAFTSVKSEDEKYTVSDLEIRDMSGNVVENIPKDGSVFANATVTKDKNRAESDYLIIAAYDENGALISFSYLLVEEKLEIGDTRTLGTMVNVPNGKALGSIKAFVWADLGTMLPVSNVTEVNAVAAE